MKRSSTGTRARGVSSPLSATRTRVTRTRASASAGWPPKDGATSRRVRGAAVIAVTLLASLTALPPAHADTRRFTDPAGDSGLPADVTTVRVNHTADLVEVAVRPGRVGFEDYFTFWLDTRPNNVGPEYRVGVRPNSDDLGLSRVGAFGEQGRPVTCDDLRATADHYAPSQVSISVPRSCLGDPGKVRVAVRASYSDGDARVIDWAPARRTFFGWVAR